jgi:hypothetical protein
MTQVTVTLPDDVAQQAQQAGLLKPDVLASMLIEAMRQRRADRLVATMDKLAALSPPLTEAEIDAEVEAARAARRASR